MTAANAHSLHVRNLVKRCGTVAAVDDVSFPGMVERVESEGFVHGAGGHRLGQIGGGARVGENLLIAIRPEKIHLSAGTPTAFANRIEGRVADWSHFGAELHLRVKVEGIGEITATHTAWKSRIPLAAGAPVWLAWDPDDAVRMVED
jgi:ABC-type Fe3+/spermidine/putrescine transport system ATPase subunit